MIDVTALEAGNVVEIFEDPMTEQCKEGRAILVEHLGVEVPCADGQELHYCVVKFLEDHPTESVERWIKVRVRKRG